MDNWQEDILEFHKVMGHYIGAEPKIPPKEVSSLRHSLISEEVNETLVALALDDMVGIADGIVDSIVVLLGTAVSYGVDIQPIWDEIHKTNMAKLGGGEREDGKSLKPEGWKPPEVDKLLKLQGWEGEI